MVLLVLRAWLGFADYHRSASRGRCYRPFYVIRVVPLLCEIGSMIPVWSMCLVMWVRESLQPSDHYNYVFWMSSISKHWPTGSFMWRTSVTSQAHPWFRQLTFLSGVKGCELSFIAMLLSIFQDTNTSNSYQLYIC